MKREHHHLCPNPGTDTKSKPWQEEEESSTQDNNTGGMDELLAVLGYKVKSSDMADVAQKLEQLEEAMVNVQGTISHLSSETVHYNPSDLNSWLETVLSEISDPFSAAAPAGAPPQIPPEQKNPSFSQPNTITPLDFTEKQHPKPIFEDSSSDNYDLKAIPGKAIFETPSTKRLKPSISNSNPIFTPTTLFPAGSYANSGQTELTRQIVLVDSQENGIRLVHALMACAEAVQQTNFSVAEALVKQIGFLAVSQAGAMRKVATYFAEALARKIYHLYPQNPNLDNSLSDFLQIHFYESCPYLKFAHFTANQAILEAFEGKNRVHVIDFSMNQGLQWPALMQALALRPGGPPAFRLTGIGPPAPDNSDQLQEVGWKLAQFAETIHVEFEYRGFVCNSLADLESEMLDLRSSQTESVAVNSVFEMHKLLARTGAFEKVMGLVRGMRPEIFTVVEQEAAHNGPGFLDRFTEALHYYSTLFDSLEGSVEGEDKAMSEVYLGKQICNVVACEGVDRIERHETLVQWRDRFGSAGFGPVHLGSNAFKQASMLLALFAGGDGYRVEENDGCLMLGWHTRPLIATSAWRLG